MKKPIDLPKIGERLAFNNLREQTFGQRSEGIMTIGAGKRDLLLTFIPNSWKALKC